jgi:hypothetical protein
VCWPFWYYTVTRQWLLELHSHRGRDMGVTHNSWIKAAVHGVEEHIIANREKIQTGHLNSQDHVHNVLGQKTHSDCGILASRLNNQCRCLLQQT